MAETGWGAIPQANMEFSWPEQPTNNSNSLQMANWGTNRPSAPSENNWGTKKPAQESWGQNKSENSWISRNDRNDVVQDFTNRSLPEKEPAKLSSNLPSVNSKSSSIYNDQRDEEETLDNLELQTVIQRSYESLNEEQFAELDEDKWDPSYESVPISSSKPQLDVYKDTGHVEPLTTSSNFSLPKKEFRNVEVQTDPIDLSKIIASREKLLTCTIDSQIRRDYQQIEQDSSRSVTNSVFEKSYPPQQPITPSLLDVGPEEWSRLNMSTKVENTEGTWITSSSKPDFSEDSMVIPPTKPDTNARALDNDSLGGKPIQTPPNNDNWVSKPQETPQETPPSQNDNRGVALPVQKDSWGPAPPVQKDSWGPTPPVQKDSWGPAPPEQPDSRGTIPQQTPAQNNDSQPVQNNNWYQQPSQPKDIIPQEAPKDSNENWGTTAKAHKTDEQGSRMTPQGPLSVSNNNWDGSNINKSDSWNKDSQPFEIGSSAQANELTNKNANTDNWGNAPAQPTGATWGNPQSNINKADSWNKEPQPNDMGVSAQANELPKKNTNTDSWGNPPAQPTDATWGNPQSNINKEDSWNKEPQMGQANELPKKNVNTDSWGNPPAQPTDATWNKANNKEPQPYDIGVSAQANELPKKNVNTDSWGNPPAQPTDATWNKANNKEPQPYDIGVSAQANELPKKNVNTDSWGNPPAQPTDATWNNPQSINKATAPAQQTGDSWGAQNVGGSTNDWTKQAEQFSKELGQSGGSTNDWTKQAEQFSKELGQSGGSTNDWTKQAEQFSKELGQSQNVGGSTNDWTKQAEQFSKELGESGEKNVKETQWGQTGYETGQKAEDSYGAGSYDSYSSNNRYGRGCRNCGQEGHFARDCPEKKQAYGGGRSCHKCGKEGHFARECTEEGSGYGGGYGGGKSCHKCGKEGHFARECTEEGSGYGGGYGGGKSCHKCGKEGHFARDCTEEGSGYGGGYGGGKSCHKCGKEGHFARDCTEEGSGYGGGRTCRKCGKEGHIARDCLESGSAYGGGYGGGSGNFCYKCDKPGHRPHECNEDAYETTGEPERSREFNTGGQSRVHTKLSPFSNPEHSDISSQDAWAKLLKADKEKELDDFKDALELYAKVTPNETFQTIERKLRASNCNARIIALEREILLNKVIVDLQGNTNKKYVANPIMVHPSRLAKTAGTRARDERENLEWLGDSGYIVDDHSPICFNCKQKGHLTKDCPEPKREIEKQPPLACQNCDSSEHMTKFCPQERRDYYAEARDRKVGGSYNHEDRAYSGYDGEEKSFRGYGSNSSQTCHNCNREGHISRDCPEPRRGGRKCHKCGEEGHLSRDCTSSSGGDYDRGSYNGGSAWQKDSSSWNNNNTAPWNTQDKSSKSDNNFQENSWNKARNDQENENSWNKVRSDQVNSWNKSGSGDNVTSTSSRDDYRKTQNQGGNYTSDNAGDSTQPTKDSWDNTETTTRHIDWGYKTAEDFGWGKMDENKTSTPDDYENKRSRGNESYNKGPDDYDNRRGRGNGSYNKGSDDYENRRGRGNGSYNKGPDDRRSYSNESYNKGPDDYDNRRNRGNESYNKGPDDYDNRRSRGNESYSRGPDDRRSYSNESYNKGPIDYENRRSRGNESYNKGPDEYDNRRSRGNESYNKGPGDRRGYSNESYNKSPDDYDNRRSRGNESYSRGPQEPNTRSPQSNANPNLDNVSAWWEQ